MPRLHLRSGLLALLAALAFAGAGETRPGRGTVVELGLVLDDSAGMASWHDAARIEIGRLLLESSRWRPAPHVRLGLVMYGTDELGRARVAHDLGEDVDGLLDVLGGTEGKGGVEDVASAIEHAHESLRWSRTAAVQALVLIGNESPHQVPGRDPRDAARAAARDGLVVHVLYAGHEGDLFAAEWKEIAEAGGGAMRLLVRPSSRRAAQDEAAEADAAKRWIEQLVLPADARPRLLARHRRVSKAFAALGAEALDIRRALVAAGLIVPREDLVGRHQRGELDPATPDGWPAEQAQRAPEERRRLLDDLARRRAEARDAWCTSMSRATGEPQGALVRILAAQARAAGFTRTGQSDAATGR
ncbi:MAG: VWA domain-containing protein [Planctomycetota bacterium]